MKTNLRVGGCVRLCFGVLIFGLLSLSAWFRPRHTKSVVESFDSGATMDPASSVAGWGTGSIKLKTAYGKFSAASLAAFPAWADAMTADDFDGDGWQDVIVSGSKYANVLALARNQGVGGQARTFEITRWLDGCSAGADGIPAFGFNGGAIDSSSFVGLTSGDYDDDGDADIFFITCARESPHAVERIFLYENLGNLSFVRHDVTSSWKTLLGPGWTSPCLESLDYDKDDDIDILYGDGSGNLHLLKNILGEAWGPTKFSFDSASPLLQTNWETTGIQSLAVTDADKDGDYDILVGSRDSSELRLYRNDGLDTFTAEVVKIFSDPASGLGGGVDVILGTDYDDDGDADFLAVVSYPGGPSAIPSRREVYSFVNEAGTFEETILFSGSVAGCGVENGCNFGAALDADHDGHPDVIAGGMNFNTGSSGRFLVQNASTGLYALSGEGITLPVDADFLEAKVVVKVELSEFSMGWIGSRNNGLKIQYYVSNDGGANWYFLVEYRDADLKYKWDRRRLDFKSWGNELVVKIVLTAQEDVDRRTRVLLGGSLETPRLDSFKITYTYEDQGEYSRATVATGLYNDENNVTHRLIVAPSFYYPGYEGRLIAYDATTMNFTTPSQYSLKTISETDFAASGTSSRKIVPQGTFIAWDAGALLKARSETSRTIYTAIPEREEDEDNWLLDRLDFTTANAGRLRRFLKEHNEKSADLIEFIRGKNRPWKLGFIDHSTPLILGPPAGEKATMGPGFDDFKNTWAKRPSVVFVGANDGMLHCFDFRTGEEKWGFIPYNLLEKLKKMRKREKRVNGFVYNSKKAEYYVDGNPVTADVYIDKNGDGIKEWTTVLICGQRKGNGKSKLTEKRYFYFALDVTDIANPQPLWEFSTKEMGETWSVPAVGKVRVNTTDKWLAFVASGYRSKDDEVFAIDLETGLVFWKYDAAKRDDKAKPVVKYKKSVPCSPRLVDINQDGIADRMYIGDFFGRLWKTDLTQATWTPTVIYQDKTGLPILTKPAVWINRTRGDTTPHLYFGTGGDDTAPEDDLYSFIALLDGSTPTIEWIVGNKSDFSISNDKVKGSLAAGERVWADPVVSDDIVYFSTFCGDIENISFDVEAGEIGKLYARHVNDSNPTLIGASVFGTTAFLNLNSKSRQAVVTSELRQNSQGKNERDILIQELDSTLEAITRGGGTTHVENPKQSTSKLRVKSWREVYQIIK